MRFALDTGLLRLDEHVGRRASGRPVRRGKAATRSTTERHHRWSPDRALELRLGHARTAPDVLLPGLFVQLITCPAVTAVGSAVAGSSLRGDIGLRQPRGRPGLAGTRARSLLTVRAAISSARPSGTPRSRSASRMCSYWRSRFGEEPLGMTSSSHRRDRLIASAGLTRSWYPAIRCVKTASRQGSARTTRSCRRRWRARSRPTRRRAGRRSGVPDR